MSSSVHNPTTQSLSSKSQDKLILYGDVSNRGGRIIWALEELELTYTLCALQLFKGEQRTAEFLALNPKGKVPTLVIQSEGNDPEVISESAAILYALAERDHNQSLLPTSPRDRAQLHEWMAFGMTELEPPIWVHAKHSFVYPEKRRIPEVFPSCEYDYQRALNHLETELSDGRAWLCGTQFTIADIFIGQTLMWAQLRKLGEVGPMIKAYLARAQKRPAWLQTFGSLMNKA